VTGLPLVVREPMGQIDLRSTLWNALEVNGPNSKPPRTEMTENPVFQYVGLIDAPTQIEFLSQDRLTFDFRRNQVKAGDGEWIRPDALDPATSRRFLDLVHFWERLVLARGRSKEPN
jgi:hypothetical protein